MATLKQSLAEKKASEPTLRRNPEIDAKLDRFIADNPKLMEYYDALSKPELIRKLMLGKMQRNDYAESRNLEIREWVAANPEIRDRIEHRIRNVPAERRERAFINAAKSEAQSYTVQAQRIKV